MEAGLWEGVSQQGREGDPDTQGSVGSWSNLLWYNTAPAHMPVKSLLVCVSVQVCMYVCGGGISRSLLQKAGSPRTYAENLRLCLSSLARSPVG